jgi:hypothetical protein
MYYDYMLKFQSEQECVEALFDAVSNEESEVLVKKSKYSGAAVDVIGTIYKVVEGETVPTLGYHVNLRSITPVQDIELWIVTPTPITPYRVWA